MRKQYILAHDLGTTGNKAVLVHCEKGVQKAFFAPYNTYYPAPTWAEQDPGEWWNAVVTSTRSLLRCAHVLPEDLACLVFSGQMMGCVPVDRYGNPLRRAIIWADQRATGELQELLNQCDLQEIYNITGHRVGPAYSALKIMWIRKHEYDVFRQSHKFLQAKDFIIHRLTGKWVTDYSDACGTGLLDIKSKQWSERMLRATGISEALLPEIFPSDAVIGEVAKEASRMIGLPPGLPVVVGGGDGVCATAGAGVVTPTIGHVYLGSSAWVAGASDSPVFDPQMRTFTWPHVDPALYSPNGTMHNAGSALEWAKTALAKCETKVAEWCDVNPYDLIEKEAERVPPGAAGLLFLPYLMGERSPYWNPNARGVFLGITRRHTTAHLLRAVYEGVALNLRTIFLVLKKELGLDFSETRLIGGGAVSHLWTRILANVLDTSLWVTTAPLEATAIGAAMAGAVGVGLLPNFKIAAERFVGVREVVEPGPEKEFYAHMHKIFLETYEAVTGIFEQLVLLVEEGVNGLA
ncbi:MAG: FGGY-family carbohydrate kinase [Candidatus Bathyarchaeia archaeon]|uniref:xylulokinase n=1 Tax=Thermofilum sp. TaxID=1961369 RepID=UPI00316DA435